jgi:hypothetical protein
VKERKDYLNYNLSSFKVNAINFPIKIWEEEVNLLSQKERKANLKLVKSFIASTISFLSLSSKSMAAPSVANTVNPMSIGGIPPEIMTPLVQLLGTALGLSVALAMILMMSAGAMRMFRQKEKAISWTNDIIRGLIQILVSIPVVFLLYLAVTTILGNFSIFSKPF